MPEPRPHKVSQLSEVVVRAQYSAPITLGLISSKMGSRKRWKMAIGDKSRCCACGGPAAGRTMIVLVFGKETERRGVSVVMKDIMTGKNNNMVDKAWKCREQAFAQHRGWTVIEG